MEKKKIIIWGIVILVIIILIVGGYFLINSKKSSKKMNPPKFANITDKDWCKKGNNIIGYNSSFFNHLVNFLVVNKTKINNRTYCEVRTPDQKAYYLSSDKKELLNKTSLSPIVKS